GRDVLVAVLGGVVVRADELALNGEGPVVGGGEQGRQVAHGDPVAVVLGVAVGPPHVGRVGVELVGGGADQGVPQLRGGLLGGVHRVVGAARGARSGVGRGEAGVGGEHADVVERDVQDLADRLRDDRLLPGAGVPDARAQGDVAVRADVQR